MENDYITVEQITKAVFEQEEILQELWENYFFYDFAWEPEDQKPTEFMIFKSIEQNLDQLSKSNLLQAMEYRWDVPTPREYDYKEFTFNKPTAEHLEEAEELIDFCTDLWEWILQAKDEDKTRIKYHQENPKGYNFFTKFFEVSDSGYEDLTEMLVPFFLYMKAYFLSNP